MDKKSETSNIPLKTDNKLDIRIDVPSKEVKQTLTIFMKGLKVEYPQAALRWTFHLTDEEDISVSINTNSQECHNLIKTLSNRIGLQIYCEWGMPQQTRPYNQLNMASTTMSSSARNKDTNQLNQVRPQDPEIDLGHEDMSGNWPYPHNPMLPMQSSNRVFANRNIQQNAAGYSQFDMNGFGNKFYPQYGTEDISKGSGYDFYGYPRPGNSEPFYQDYNNFQSQSYVHSGKPGMAVSSGGQWTSFAPIPPMNSIQHPSKPFNTKLQTAQASQSSHISQLQDEYSKVQESQPIESKDKRQRKPSNVLYVKGLDQLNTGIAQVANLFDCFGNVQIVMFHKKKDYTLVKLGSVEEATYSMDELYGKEVAGRNLLLHYSEFEEIVPKYYTNEKCYYTPDMDKKALQPKKVYGHMSKFITIQVCHETEKTIYTLALLMERLSAELADAKVKEGTQKEEFHAEFPTVGRAVQFAMNYNYRDISEDGDFIAITFKSKLSKH